MFVSKRYIYTVFMCHLCVEKALKGVFAKIHKINAPKTHDLVYICEKINIKFPEKLEFFLDNLNDLSVPTRYPDELSRLLKAYKKDKTKKLLNQTRELLLWLKKML